MTLEEFQKQENAQAVLVWTYDGKLWSNTIRMHHGVAQFYTDGDWVDEVPDAYRDCSDIRVITQ